MTIAVLSQKGGTGKTTAVRTLADAFRRGGVSTLAVDLDPQGNLSDYFDLPPDVQPTIADVLSGRATAAEAIHEDLIPANLSLAEAELMLGAKMGRELTLRRALAQAEVGERYELILIDCPPSLGLLTVNALVAADRALVTAEAQYFALQGVEQAMEVIELARESLNPELQLLGVLLNLADMRTVHSREALVSLKERFGERVLRYRRSAPRSPTPSRPSAPARSSTTGPISARTISRSPPKRSRGWTGSRTRASGWRLSAPADRSPYISLTKAPCTSKGARSRLAQPSISGRRASTTAPVCS